MTLIVGLTGGIGSGKSTFSKELTKRNIKTLDSDKEVALIYKKPTKKFLHYLKKIGLSGSTKSKKINKRLISEKIFSNKETKKQLENYIFKITRKKRHQFIKREKKRKTKIIFLDIPLLFENKLNNEFDLIISILSTKKNRYNRLKLSKNMSKTQFGAIIKTQTSDVVRKNNSDIVIYNNNTMVNYISKINKILDRLIL